MNLTGKTILITRSAHQTNELVHLIEQNGGTPIVFPTIEILPTETWDRCDRAIDSLYMYDGVIFTSTNGVEFFIRRMKERGREASELRGKIICVVGETTRRAIEQLGVPVTTMPEKFTALDLATKLQQEDLDGKTFLFPRGNLANDALPEILKRLGASVDAVTVYRTQKPNPENTENIQSMLLAGEIDVVTFTSPSTVQNFVALFSARTVRRFQQHCAFAAIGPRTAAALKQFGLQAGIVARESTVQGLVRAIANHFQSAA